MDEGAVGVPQLTGEALAAVRYRGGHLQIVASAGAGKTEVVSQRVADLLATGVAPDAMVAFTFTERAARELKERITQRVAARLGEDTVDRLNGLFVGTIHAFCFRLLQQYVPRYETYDVLDDNQLTAFLCREANRLDLRQFDANGRLFRSVDAFAQAVDIVENELIDPAAIPEPLGPPLRRYYETLDRYRLLTYGQQIVAAVRELENPSLATEIHGRLRHLIVDEYQDVNPAQERLIRLLAGPDVQLCVVGDDQQAIYQWRGSDVRGIVSFRDRYPNVASFTLTTNRRSRPQIIEVANGFAESIPERLDKRMEPHRPPLPGDQPSVVAWRDDTEAGEAGWIASMVLDAAEAGVPYRDMAVLVRSRAAYRQLIEQFATFDIPVQPGARLWLFDQPEAKLIGQTFAWLAGVDWRETYQRGQPVTADDLVSGYVSVFGLAPTDRQRIRRFLEAWRAVVLREDRTANLVGELYELYAELGVARWDLTDAYTVNRLGTLARITTLLADFETVRRRARPDPDAAGEQVGGQDRGRWYYTHLAVFIVNYAQTSYEAFEGESGHGLDAVDVTTVHRAKGLEWPVVFVPSMTAGRFPSPRTGDIQPWLVPREMFDAARYEGTDADERRLFYVAMTRTRDRLSISRHERVTTRRVAASPYFAELGDLEIPPDQVTSPRLGDPAVHGDEPLTVTYSQLAAYMDCGMAYRLRELIGFQPRLAIELGYGKAVHHVMRAVAEATRSVGQVPTESEVDRLLDASFFLPTANRAAHRQLRDAARRLVVQYTQAHADDLFRVWETERPFELHLDGVTVTGRADVILDREGGDVGALAIVDYKTSVDSTAATDYALQLQVYADAGRREGLDVRAAYVHDLKAGQRQPIEVDPAAVVAAEAAVTSAAAGIRARDFTPCPGPRCRRCEVRTVCGSAQR